MEVAGLALGVTPLILSALENYERILRPLQIFSKDYTKEADNFQLALRVQKEVFANECQILLRSVAEHQNEVRQMFNNYQHPLWQDQDFGEQLHARLGDAFEGCIAAVTLVERTLSHIVKNYGRLHILLDQSQASPFHELGFG